MAGVRDYSTLRCPGADSLELATLIQAHSDGTPLFVAALLDHLIRRGWLIETDPGWALAVPLSEVDLGVPDDVREILRTELRSLRPRSRAVLETASVAGIEFDAQAVAAALGTPTDATEAVCERLARAGRFLRIAGSSTWPDGSVARRYAFRHALHRQVTYDDVPEARRRERHQRLGEALERGYAGQTAPIAGTLAYHFERGGDQARTLTYLAAAAAGAQERFAPRQVIAYLESALRLLERQPDGAERRRQELGLRLQIGPSLNAVHGYASDAVRANYDRALALCDEHTGAAQRYAVLYALFHSRSVRGERPATRRTAEALVEQAAHLGAAERWLASRCSGGRRCSRGRSPRPGPVWSRCARPGRTLWAPTPRCSARRPWWHWMGISPRRSGTSVSPIRRKPFRAMRSPAVSRATALSPSPPRSSIPPTCPTCAASRPRPPGLPTSSVLWRSTRGWRTSTAWRTRWPGWALAQRGDAAGAVERIEAGLVANRADGARLVRAPMLCFLAEARGRLGNREAALAAADEGLELSQHTLNAMQGPELWRIKGELLAGSYHSRPRARGSARARQSAVEAEQCIRKGIDLARTFGSPSLELRAALSLADLMLARGAGDEARAVVGPVYRRFTEGLDCEDLKRAAALLASA